MDKIEALHRTSLAILQRQDAGARDKGTRALHLIGLAGGLLLVSLALLEFTGVTLDGTAKAALLALLVGGATTTVSGTYLLAMQMIREDPWEEASVYLWQMILADDMDSLRDRIREMSHMHAEKQRYHMLRLTREDAIILLLALCGLLAEVGALLTLAFVFWQS